MADATSTDALWRWILGGLAAGAIVLGLLVAAYAIGYDRGGDDARQEAVAPTETVTTETTPSGGGSVATGEQLWTSTGCAGCHSIDGSASVGPSVKGLAGSQVELDSGQTVTADDAYLAVAITDPDKDVVAGFKAGVMSAAVAAQKFDTRADDVDALVAYIKEQR